MRKILETREDEELRRKRVSGLWETSRVPDLHASRRLGDLVVNERWARCYRLLIQKVDKGRTVVLTGDRGNGKTQAAVEAIRHATGLVNRAIYIKRRHLALEIRQAMNEKTRGELQVIEYYGAKPWLLVIDEFQDGNISEYDRANLTDVIDLRYGSALPTVIIANYDPKRLVDILGDSVIDRLNEGGGIIHFDWPSFRGLAND